MRRAPVVLTATGAGLAALLSFHTTSLTGHSGPLVSASGPGTGGTGTGGTGTGTTGSTGTGPSAGPAAGSSAGAAAGSGSTATPSPGSGPTTTAAARPGTAPGPPAAGGSSSTPSGSAPGASAPTSPPTSSPAAAPTPTTSPPTTAAPTTTTTSGTRRANGSDVVYRYGELELQVTISGGQITDIEPVIDNAADERSAQINGEAEPQLRQQALQAQSANIDGVSGATYTSNAYVQSLQAALNKLGWTH